MDEAIPWTALREAVLAQFRLGAESPHGPAHWERVERVGLTLATATGADPFVVRLFAWFHDAGRVAEEHDPGHGTRGAALAVGFHRRGLLPLSHRRLALLIEACDGHTEVLSHVDPTIATCFDADRLDLVRYSGTKVDPRLLNTIEAKRWASGWDQELLPA